MANLGLGGPNPYITQQAKAIQDQSNLNLKQNIMPGIGQSAMGAGQYGGTRQGIAQGVAAGNAQAGIAGAQANLYGQAYEQDQNRGLQQQQINNAFNLGGRQIDTTQRGQDQSFGLGLGNLAVNNKQADNTFALGNRQADNTRLGQDQNFYTQQRGQDLQGTALGANLFGQSNTGNLGIGQGQYDLGRQFQYAPMDANNRFGNAISPFSGLGGSQTNSANTGGGALGFAGGALAGGQFANNMGGNLGFGNYPYTGYGGATGGPGSLGFGGTY